MFRRAAGLLVVLPLSGSLGQAQLVVSAQAGLIHHIDGQVLVEDRPVAPHPNQFARISQGQILRTQQGQAEVLLSPGAVLRVGPSSEIRLISDDISHVKIAVLRGSAIVERRRQSEPSVIEVECGEVENGTVTTLDIQARGVYRGDVRPGGDRSLRVFRGQGSFYSAGPEEALRTGQMAVMADGRYEITEFDPAAADSLDAWNQQRSEIIRKINKLGRRSDQQLARGFAYLARHVGKRAAQKGRRRFGYGGRKTNNGRSTR